MNPNAIFYSKPLRSLFTLLIGVAFVAALWSMLGTAGAQPPETSLSDTTIRHSPIMSRPVNASLDHTPKGGVTAGAKSQLLNIATRLRVQTGDNAMIGGFIITGTQPKTVIVRGIGPSLPMPGALSDPVIEVHGPSGEFLGANDNWNDALTRQEIIDSGLAPTNPLEAALWGVINPGAYTVVVRGKENATGVGLFEVYDLNGAVDSQLANVSTRGLVETGDDVMIGGIIVGPAGTTDSNILVRAIGPSLGSFGIHNPLADPILQLHDGNGALLGGNDNWRDTQATEIEATGIPPQHDLESALLASVPPGAYTAIVAGKGGGIGVGLVEVYRVAPPNTATLIVRTFFPSDIAANGIGGPGPAGVIVSVNGNELGTTQPDGTLSLQVPAGTLEVAAEYRPSNSGQTSVTLVPGETKQVDVVMAEGKELSENSVLTVDQLAASILDRNFTALTLRFLRSDGSTVSLKSLDFVTLEDAQGGTYASVTQFFTLQPNGTLFLNDVNSFRNLLLARSGKILLSVHGDDVDGGVNAGTAEFFVSAYSITGNLAAPPSNPGLNKAGITITGSILNTDLVFTVVSDANGNFKFPLLPAGNFDFASETQQNGQFYYGQGTVVLNANKVLHINMLATEDLINGVAPFTVENAGGSNAELDSKLMSASAAERRATAATRPFRPTASGLGILAPETEPTTVSVNVTAGQQNTPVTQKATFNVPQGTKTVNLTYTVQTDEYPYYVKQQSIYNDTWSIAVRGGSSGQQIFSEGRQINSQLTVSPVWQSDGTTGAIKKTFNVENLSAAGPTTLVLFASATNVGDSILPTRVSATLGPDSAVKITKITPDSSVPLNLHSIPRPAPNPDSKNVFDRFFTLDISKPDGSTVKKLTVTLLGPGTLMTVVDEAPGGASVQQLNENSLRVRVSLKDKSSTVASQPPPAHLLKYHFKLVVTANGSDVSDEKDSGERRGLWRMPNGLARFSPASATVGRDDGGDDWCSRGAYNWLSANSSLFSTTSSSRITSINDISGEHGRNIGHSLSHFYGTDIDMFHFYTFPGAGSGGENYAKLIEDVKAAVNTTAAGQAARQRVTDWATKTRSGLDTLAAKTEVRQLIYANGWGYGPKHLNEIGLTGGWARALLTTGKTSVGGSTLDLGLVAWSNTKYIAANDHNDHVHLALDRVALQE
jgi:hypothetical protein